MNTNEVLKLALEALECTEYPQDHYDAITALREALAEQPAQQQTMYLESGGAGYGPAPERKLIIGYVNKPEQPAKEENT